MLNIEEPLGRLFAPNAMFGANCVHSSDCDALKCQKSWNFQLAELKALITPAWWHSITPCRFQMSFKWMQIVTIFNCFSKVLKVIQVVLECLWFKRLPEVSLSSPNFQVKTFNSCKYYLQSFECWHLIPKVWHLFEKKFTFPITLSILRFLRLTNKFHTEL